MELFHREFGAGPPVVVVHGLFGFSDNWQTVAMTLIGVFALMMLRSMLKSSAPPPVAAPQAEAAAAADAAHASAAETTEAETPVVARRAKAL